MVLSTACEVWILNILNQHVLIFDIKCKADSTKEKEKEPMFERFIDSIKIKKKFYP